MEYIVYKRTHGANVRYYVKPLDVDAPKDAFGAFDAVDLACEKARELNEQQGQLALAA